MSRQRLIASLVAFSLLAPAARAEVRLGDNVHIGGHDVSHQTFNRHRRAVFYLYEGQPNPSGCAWRRNEDGSQTKVCRYKILH